MEPAGTEKKWGNGGFMASRDFFFCDDFFFFCRLPSLAASGIFAFQQRRLVLDDVEQDALDVGAQLGVDLLLFAQLRPGLETTWNASVNR